VRRPGPASARRPAARIVETGTSAWGVDSTLLLESYVRHFGGRFDSVDLRALPSDRLRPVVGPTTHLHVGDSVAFIAGLADEPGVAPVDLAYLDSYDLDWADPAPSEAHVEATGSMPGKGARLLRELAGDPTVETLWHGYDVLLRIRA
jgi:hypothetical protein